jgi:hypothetical protein
MPILKFSSQTLIGSEVQNSTRLIEDAAMFLQKQRQQSMSGFAVTRRAGAVLLLPKPRTKISVAYRAINLLTCVFEALVNLPYGSVGRRNKWKKFIGRFHQ